VSRESNPFASPDWLEIQRRYLEVLSKGVDLRSEKQDDAAGPAQWYKAAEQWWSSVLPRIPGESQSLFSNILHQSQSFSSMTDQFARLLAEMATAGKEGNDWQAVLKRHITRMQEQFSAAGMAGGADKLTDQWLSALGSWQRAGMAVYPDEVFKGMDGDAVKMMADRFLSLPAVGPGADYVNRLQATLRLWREYQERCRQYHHVFSHLARDALVCLEQKILQLGKENKKITSLRELYNLWVDCNEQVFSEHAASEEYAILYGELIASFMTFRRHSQQLLDSTMERLDLPTRESMASVREKQRELHRQLLESQEQQRQTQTTVEELRAELAELRRQTGQDKLAPKRRQTKKKNTGSTRRGSRTRKD
jgi:class III poly(R)-hydroxyalkanoic acid synthase PhaE subunit